MSCSILFVRAEFSGARADVHVLLPLHGTWQGPGAAAQVPVVVALPHPVPDVPVCHKHGAGALCTPSHTLTSPHIPSHPPPLTIPPFKAHTLVSWSNNNCPPPFESCCAWQDPTPCGGPCRLLTKPFSTVVATRSSLICIHLGQFCVCATSKALALPLHYPK